MASPSKSIRLCQMTAVASFLVLATTPAQAYFPLVTDDTGTQGKGGHQIELDYVFEKSSSRLESETGVFIENTHILSNAFPMAYTYGVSENVDVFFGMSRQTSPINGWQSSELGLKWVFAGDQTQGWSAAIKPVVTLPVSNAMQDNGLGAAKTNVGVTLIGSFLADTHEWHFNVGYASNQQANTPSLESERPDLWSASLAPVLVLHPQWKLAFDMGIQTNAAYNSQYGAFGEVALIYAPMENLQLGLGVTYASDINASDKAHTYGIATGITYQF